MASKITLFFFELSRGNWGFPWHIILAWVFYELLIKVSMLWAMAAFIVILTGLIYELIQDDKDGWQDNIANMLGVILGIIF